MNGCILEQKHGQGHRILCWTCLLWSVAERSYAMVITLSADKRRSLSHFVRGTVCSFRLAFALGLKIPEAENKPTVGMNEIKAYY